MAIRQGRTSIKGKHARPRRYKRVQYTYDFKHADLKRLLQHATAFPSETSPVALGEFDATAADDTLAFLQSECQVLIIDAGDLGCELLKNVVLSGFTKVHIIDMDTIDVSNLNRQSTGSTTCDVTAFLCPT